MDFNTAIVVAIILWSLSVMLLFLYLLTLENLQKKSLALSLRKILDNGVLTFSLFEAAKNNRKRLNQHIVINVLNTLIEELGQDEQNWNEATNSKIEQLENIKAEFERQASLAELPDTIKPKLQRLRKICPNAENDMAALVEVIGNEFVSEKKKRKKAQRYSWLSLGFTLITSLLFSLPSVSSAIERFLFGG